ncbi:MAG TPA: hypothetical protein PKG95_11750, partial [Anaerolineaceae bacterium]|nr:hypothetical protein [Anaerolineaceae bacterium]
MKLALIGGGGVRSPLFVMTLLRWQSRVGVSELCLHDVDAHKLELLSALCRTLLRRAGDPFTLTATTDARTALTGADHVVTTIRVGFEQGRAQDERIALRHGVLGQETTGPGGFAMALRSIPAILGYAELLRQINPGAWMYNFTNPAGLVTQALRDAGYDRTIGICDGANLAQQAVAHWAGVDPGAIRAEVFGLNHLSWCRRAWLGAEDLLPQALADDRFLQEAQGVFDPALVRQLGMYLNEYLYYYYHAEQALAAISGESQTRGEEIVELNQRLLLQLGAVDLQRDPEKALRIFFGYEKRRGATYMHYAHGGLEIEAANRQPTFDADIPAAAGEGYAGVALSIIAALQGGDPMVTALNVPNQGAIAGMAAGDVVEASCRVDRTGVHILPVGDIPAPQLGLMQS